MALFTKPIKTRGDLFVHMLQDIYYAEHQITKALPQMIGKATDQSVKNAFQTHLQETEDQITRLEQVFRRHPGGAGEAARSRRHGRVAGADAGGGKGDRPQADGPGSRQHQQAGCRSLKAGSS